VIGMAARFASEKGVEVLLNALPLIIQKYPRAQVIFAGQHQDVLGEKEYYQRLFPAIEQYQKEQHWKFAGVLNPAEMAAFYPNLDILVVPSLNSTEAFGLVQIEAMINGVPCVASDLPGVRQPVLTTGMGKIIPIGDAQALAHAILEIQERGEKFHGDAAAIAQRFTPDSIAREYEALFEELLITKRRMT